jgi:hypothetical protein
MSIMYLTYAIVYSNLHFDVSLEIIALHTFLPKQYLVVLRNFHFNTFHIVENNEQQECRT